MANWQTPSDLKYLKTDEWVRIEGDTATVGVSDYAQDQLNDIVFVELPEVGEKLSLGDRLASVESVKAASDIFTPLAGTVAEVNTDLNDNSELVNADPFGKGWLVKLTIEPGADNPALMDAEAYAKWCETR